MGVIVGIKGKVHGRGWRGKERGWRGRERGRIRERGGGGEEGRGEERGGGGEGKERCYTSTTVYPNYEV